MHVFHIQPVHCRQAFVFENMPSVSIHVDFLQVLYNSGVKFSDVNFYLYRGSY